MNTTPAQLPAPLAQTGGLGYDVGPRGGVRPAMKFQWWYDHLIDYRLANPDAKLQDMADYCKRTVPWISLVVNSDAFKARYAQRREALNTGLSEHVQTKILAAAGASLDKLLDRIEKKGDVLPMTALLEASDKLLGHLGYGSKQGPTSVNVNVQQNNGGNQPPVTVTATELEAARRDLRGVEAANAAETQQEVQAPETLGSPGDFGRVLDLEVSE